MGDDEQAIKCQLEELGARDDRETAKTKKTFPKNLYCKLIFFVIGAKKAKDNEEECK